MPIRMLRDWTDSEAVNNLSANAEVLFIRLIMKVDDFGRFTADPKILRPLLFPMRLEQTREADLQRQLQELEKAGLVRLYEHAGKRLMEIVKFDQRMRAKHSKYPGPEQAKILDTCQSYDGHVSVTCQSYDGHMTAERNRIESESESESEKNNAHVDKDSFLIPEVLKTPEFLKAWNDWVIYRKQKRKKLTPKTIEGQMKFLEDNKNNAVQIIRESIRNDWQGLFPLKQGTLSFQPATSEKNYDL